ncbi:MAG: bifunctional UDP-N-acetylglucosamine pyrophosphorylase / glucosamine-phosphate N-acetyltransferase [Blastocatellia bacterium]|jgi:bifunctional UDP-N-acetylglucosamine pyrophosphorylase/glucosamine-1-phosphate N-acetyltransferase|nr:bifunctional UDP-N-acetylglucosamine pyrophosphorylase / glucosamine-phosphate N-acetyltransferase [Blastocatellia bacterium]
MDTLATNGTKKRPLDVLIMAAGLGTRMRSEKAKVLHQLDGRSLVAHVCRAAAALNPRRIYIVVGHQAEEVAAAVSQEFPDVTFVQQAQQRGTGDAVLAAKGALAESDATVLVLSGDVPLVRAETLAALLNQHDSATNPESSCTILSVKLENPRGYGRIVRDQDGRFEKIVEEKDASDEEREIREINAGLYCFHSTSLFQALERVQPTNQQGEYYLTDVPAILRTEGKGVNIYLHPDAREVSGINTRADLAEFENLLRRTAIRRLMTEGGVTFIDPSHAYISADAQIGRDTVIYPGVSIEGNSQVGERCEIRSGSRITNSRLGNGVVVKDHCVVMDSEITDDCTIGPFAHLRMNSRMEPGAVVGNFVEVKKTRIGRGTKSMHLTYLGDAIIGEKTNIGAGTVTCNYDGKDKHQTIIEDNVRIGSDTMLIAPVRVGSGSVTAAGSVVTQDVPSNTLVAGVPAVVKKRLDEKPPENTTDKK